MKSSPTGSTEASLGHNLDPRIADLFQAIRLGHADAALAIAGTLASARGLNPRTHTHSKTTTSPDRTTQLQHVWGETPLGPTGPAHLAAHLGLTGLCMRLVALGAPKRDGQGLTLLHWAASGGQAQTCKALMGFGYFVNDESAFGLRPLHLAAERGHSATCMALLKSGANVDAMDDLDETALVKAARHGHVQAFRVLVEHGALPPMRNSAFNGVMRWAESSGIADQVLEIPAVNRLMAVPVEQLKKAGSAVTAKTAVREMTGHGTTPQRSFLAHRSPH